MLEPASSDRDRSAASKQTAGGNRDGNHGSDGEETPRPDRRGHDGVQGGPHRGQRQHREATTILRKRGLAQATKKAGRSTNEGLIGSYIHMGGKIGVLVEVNCESDFVARTEDFQSSPGRSRCTSPPPGPQYVRREEVPADVLERERGIYRGQMKARTSRRRSSTRSSKAN